MTLQEKYAAAAIGATVTATASDELGGLDRFEAERHWLNDQQAAGRVLVISTKRESYTRHRRLWHVVFKRLA
jgi:hypothetical protein